MCVCVGVNFLGTLSRYDASFQLNTMGAKNVLNFSKKCANIKLLLHVSTGEYTLFFYSSFSKLLCAF